MQNEDSREILPLTGLRFIAALFVFVFHIHLRWPLAPELPFLANIIGQGAIGMSLFFVLSGYVLALRYGDGKGDYFAYLRNRFSRIYPIYAVVALLTLPWIGISLNADTAYMMVRQAAAICVLVFANIFLIQAWFPSMFAYWNNGGSWSISVEAFCYVLLPFILMRLHGRSTRVLVCVALLAYALAVFPGLSVILLGGDWLPLYSMPIFRLPEFVLGVCVCFAVRRLRFPPGTVAALQLGASFLLLVYLGIVGNRLPGWITHNWIVLPVIALTIFSVAQSYGMFSRILATPLLVWAGKISYSFYSFQLLILLLLKSYHADLLRIFPSFGNNLILLAASFSVLLALSAAGYHWIEEPARRGFKAWRPRPRSPVGSDV